MVRCAIQIALVGIMVLLAAEAAFSQTSSAMLNSHGSVLVNDAYVKRSIAIFDGDRIEVCEDSAATLSQDGATVGLTPGSFTRYQKQTLELFHGTARVDTNSGMQAHFADITVVPSGKSARFEMTRDNNKVQVTSHQGALTINNEGQTTTLADGSTTTLPDPRESEAPHPTCRNLGALAGMSSQKALAVDLGWSAGGVLCAYLCVEGTSISQDSPAPR